MRVTDIIKEADEYQPPVIRKGDEVKVGKFKNRKAEVTGFKTDDNGQPVLKTNKGDQKLFKPRISKLEPNKVTERTEDEVGSDEISLVISSVQNMIAKRKGVFRSAGDLYYDVQLAGQLIPWMEQHFVPIWEKHGYPPIGQPAWGEVEAEFITKYLQGK